MEDINFVLGSSYDGFRISAYRDGILLHEIFVDQESDAAQTLSDFLFSLGFETEVEEDY
jgi:hypothetical protein